MARLSKAPVLILTAEDAMTPPSRWRFGPQPPNANAGVATDDMTVERITTPSSAAESFFITNSTSHAIVVNGDFVNSTNKCASIGPRASSRGICLTR